MASVQIDLDLDEIDLDEMVDHVFKKIKKVKDKGKLKHIREMLGLPSEFMLVESLDDQMKYEHIAKVFHKYSTGYFEKQLPC